MTEAPTAVNQQLQKRFRRTRKTAVAPVPPPEDTTTDRSDLMRLHRLLAGPETLANDRKRIRTDEKVSLELNDRERELILNHSFADPELTARLRLVPRPGEAPVYRFTLDELDELAGYVAAEANHANDKKLHKQWIQLYARITSVLDSYTDEDD